MNNNINLQKIADALDFDLEDVEMLVEVFIESSEESLTLLESAVNTKSYEDIYSCAHSIKGSSANLTLMHISNVAKEIEISSKELKDIDYFSLIENLKISISELKVIINEK